ncbi:MAG: sugar-transfer associated ATP-grasp domain-containing protein [bacterium]|nr:sugar-transfer associated ATP-grasp domain-containing protein [bacterium]
MKTNDILGMNARNRLYTSQNSAYARQICHSKFKTKQLMQNQGIAVAKIIAIINDHEELNKFNWKKLDHDFVIKPSNGSGGKGIVVFINRNDDDDYLDTMGQKWTSEEIFLHCWDILEGKYTSHPGALTSVIIEERVAIHPQFAKLSYHGTPDVRVIVYNHIPVMAMLRLPTKESEGRANLHQGAIGVGIDLATGITTRAITADGTPIRFYPGTKRKLNGFVVPFWQQVLLTAVSAADAAQLTYGGIDLFIDKDKGPLVVELNTSPGLNIQLANNQGLKRRLQRVSDLEVLNPEHGIKIAQALFASNLTNKFLPPDEKVMIAFTQEGEVLGDKTKQKVSFAVDTGRYRSAISRELAIDLRLCEPEDLLWFAPTETGEKAPVIEVTFILAGKKIKTAMIVSKQLDKSKQKIRLGRQDLSNFIIRG